MHESQRTLVFVGTALVAVALAAGTHWAMRPAPLEQFSDVGEGFYPDFQDPNDATALRVAAYNEDAARVDVFNVEFKNGLWRIPSHHNYPADGEERLAKTATSIIGISREALASTSPDDFKRLGVLDPLDEKVTGTTGRGDRITLFAGDQVLADYIIGNKVEGQDNVYHVRKPDEDRTYLATLNIDISTKFADWIEPDLLDIRRNDLREIVINAYSIDEARGVLVPGEVSELTRESATASWQLNDLAESQKVKTSEVSSVISGLEDLRIVGVRAKPPGLISVLKGEGDGMVDPYALAEKGFFLTKDGFLSNEGEVHVGAADGVRYVLQFGEVFTGTDVEIEVGSSSESEASDDATTDAAADDKSEDESETDGDDSEESGKSSSKQSRYLFVRAGFDESLIEGPGEKPVKPEKPEPADGSSSDESAEQSDTEETEAKDDANASDEPASAEKVDDKGDAAEQSSEEAEYQKALTEYETKLKQWEADQKAYEEKVEKGKERVKELNDRFADWYYVISAESFDKIRVSRADLIETTESEDDAEDEAATPPSAPDLPSIQPATSGGDEPASDETDASKTSPPAEDGATPSSESAEDANPSPPADEEKPSTPSSDESSADDKASEGGSSSDAADSSPAVDESTNPQETSDETPSEDAAPPEQDS